jgi:hypothetical protein
LCPYENHTSVDASLISLRFFCINRLNPANMR